MSIHEFDPTCQGCKPVLLDPKTLQPLPPDHPVMRMALSYWEKLPRDIQEAFHRVTVKNSRDPNDLAKMQTLVKEFEKFQRN